MPDPITMVGSAVGGQILSAINDTRQKNQHDWMLQKQYEYNKLNTDYNFQKQLEMWEKTGYGAQVEQMKKAGVNAGLLYGMGGGGGQSNNVATGSAGMGQAPVGGNEALGMMQQGLQLQLLNAQKANIEADTANKNQDTLVKKEDQIAKEYENVINNLVANMDENGNLVEEGNDVNRLGFKQKTGEYKAMMDKNKRENLMNNESIKKIGEEIELLKQKGLSEKEITSNLQKEGKLKDAEIAWNQYGLTKETFGQFILTLVKRLFK